MPGEPYHNATREVQADAKDSPPQINPRQELCTRMVQSFGGWIAILRYLFPKEQIVLQQLDRWQYNVAVSRAQLTVDLRWSAHFFIH